MLPDFIPRLSIGPLCGLTANALLAILCLVVSIIYTHYRPLRSLFFFYTFITFAFLGWFFWGRQGSPESVLWGYRLLYASLALLPATWFWFFLQLFNEKPRPLTWVMTGIGVLLAITALSGKGPWFFGLPLEPDPIATDFWRPQSRLLKILIQLTSLFQFIYLLLTLKYSEPARKFSNRVAAYGYRVMRYLTLNENQRPFPLAEMPAELEPPEAQVSFD